MDIEISNLIERAEDCSKKTGKSLGRIAVLAGHNADFFPGLKSGKTCSVRTLNKMLAKITEIEAA